MKDTDNVIPGITSEVEQKKHINKKAVLEMITRLQEGDIENGILTHVRNKF